MPVEVLRVPFAWCHLQLGHFPKIVLVVETVSQHIPEVAQCTLHGVCRGFLFRLFKSRRFSFAVLNVAVADILMVCSIAQRDPHDCAQAECDFAICSVLVDKVDLHVLNRRAPTVESKHLVREVDDLFCREVVDLAAASSRSR